MQKKKQATKIKMRYKAALIVMKKALCLIFSILLGFLPCIPVSAKSSIVVGEDVSAYSGSGSAFDPLHYLFDADSKVTWKHLCDLRDQGLTECYENREGNTPEGKLWYSWTFSAENITLPEGPYFLGINFYSGDTLSSLPGGSGAFYFSFACKRDLPGKAVVSIYVGDKYDNGTKLELNYYGGYDATVIHGTTPVIDSNEIFEMNHVKNIAKGVTVSEGYVSFILRYGGNYYLTENTSLQSNAKEDSTSDSGKKEELQNKKGRKTTDIDEEEAFQQSIAEMKINSEQSDLPKTDSDNKDTVRNKEENNKEENNNKVNNKGRFEAADKVSEFERKNALYQGGDSETDGETIEKAEIKNALPRENENASVVYSDEVIIGRIEELFPTDSIARAIADSLTKKLGDELSQADLNSINRLYLSGRDIKNIDELGRMTFERLKSIELADNSIRSLPKLHMPMLNYIDLSNNSLTNTEGLMALTELEVICLQNNLLTAMPDISLLLKLKSIDVSNNQIISLPELKNNSLSYLNLSNNRLSKICGLKGLPGLEYIDISGNSIRELPDFAVCKKLHEVVTKQDIDTSWHTIYIAVIFGSILAVSLFYLIFRLRKHIIHNKISS